MFIENSCESLGSVYKGKKAGGPDFADAAVFAHLQPFWRDSFGYQGRRLPRHGEGHRTSAEIPFHSGITEDEADYVAEVFEGALGDRVRQSGIFEPRFTPLRTMRIM